MKREDEEDRGRGREGGRQSSEGEFHICLSRALSLLSPRRSTGGPLLRCFWNCFYLTRQRTRARPMLTHQFLFSSPSHSVPLDPLRSQNPGNLPTRGILAASSGTMLNKSFLVRHGFPPRSPISHSLSLSLSLSLFLPCLPRSF